jgi:beta-lactamase class A
MKPAALVSSLILLLLPAAAVYSTGGWGPVPVTREVPPAQVIVTAPVPVETPPLPVAPPKTPALTAAVEEAMAGFTGRYSVVVHELGTGRQWQVNETERFHPASTIKMPVVLYALEQYRAGKLTWDQQIEYTPADFESPGGGAFETSPFGGFYPVENLVGRAIRYSNNIAVNMLGRYLGWDEIRAWSRAIDGELYRADDGTPQVTALSELGWWRRLDQLSREDPQAAEMLLAPLREVAYDGRIAAGLPEGVPYLHKFGSYDGNYHDGGIVYGRRPYILIVLTGEASEEAADASIARLSAAVYKVMSK